MSLEEWHSNKWIKKHRTDRRQVADLLASIDRHLTQSQSLPLNPEWQMAVAYQAALQSAIVALAAVGYRARGEGHHYRLIQSLRYTLGLEPNLIRTLDVYRELRHSVFYEPLVEITEANANEMVELAIELRRTLMTWLREQHPSLV